MLIFLRGKICLTLSSSLKKTKTFQFCLRLFISYFLNPAIQREIVYFFLFFFTLGKVENQNSKPWKSWKYNKCYSLWFSKHNGIFEFMTNILIFAAYNFRVSEKKKKTINEKEELSQYEEMRKKKIRKMSEKKKRTERQKWVKMLKEKRNRKSKEIKENLKVRNNK